MKKSHGPTVSVQDLADLAQELEAWDQATANRENRSLRLSEHKQAVVRQALRDALEFSFVRPHWLSLQTRFHRAKLSMRGKKGRYRSDAFARAMGVVKTGGRRSPDLSRDEADLVVWKYWELISVDGLIAYCDTSMMWASGFEAGVRSGNRNEAVKTDFAPVQHPRPVVKAPISPAEAVAVIADWFQWRFAGSRQAVRLFLERERTRLRRERTQIEGSEDPGDQLRLTTMPPGDFRIPGRATLNRRDR